MVARGGAGIGRIICSMNVGFLFGAGVSLPYAPTTEALTDGLLQSSDVRRESDGAYILQRESYPPLDDPEGIKRIRDFLTFLKSHANDFFRQRQASGRNANYEDLYYLVTQLADAVDEYENPAISKLLRVAERRYKMPPLPNNSGFQSEDLFHETRRYIRGIVSHSLSNLQPAQNHLRPSCASG
jgi:hypothetical protein